MDGSPVGSDAPEDLAAHRMHDCAPLELERLMMHLQERNAGRIVPVDRTRQCKLYQIE